MGIRDHRIMNVLKLEVIPKVSEAVFSNEDIRYHSENGIWLLVVGRKTGLLVILLPERSQNEGYSMIGTAEVNELDQQKYLSFLLKHRPKC